MQQKTPTPNSSSGSISQSNSNNNNSQPKTNIGKNQHLTVNTNFNGNQMSPTLTPLPSNDILRTPCVLSIASPPSGSTNHQTPNENAIIMNKYGAIAAAAPKSTPAPSASTREKPVEVWKLFPHIRVMRQDRGAGQPSEFFVHKMILDKQKGEREMEHYNLCRHDHLRHPNLLLYKNAIKHTDGRVEINMEYANCGTLDIALRDMSAKLRHVAAKACARQIFGGAAYYYQIHNRVNRDSKPSNYFLQHNGTVKVGDFDVSRTLGNTDSLNSSLNNNNNNSSNENITKAAAIPSSSQSFGCASSVMNNNNNANNMGNVQITGLRKRRGMKQQQEQQQQANDNNDNDNNNINDNTIDASLLPPIDTVEYTQVGTEVYAAPEIIDGKRRIIPQVVEPWSIGASLWTLLEGQPPFQRFKLKKFEAPKQAEHVDRLPWDEVATDPALHYLLKRTLVCDPYKRAGLVEALAITHVVQNPTNRPLRSSTSSASSASAASSFSSAASPNLDTSELQRIRTDEDESWKNSFSDPEGENVQIAKSFNIKLCDDVLRECCCNTNDPEIDRKVKRAARAMEAEFQSWKVARNAVRNDHKSLSAVDGCMIKIMRNERCIPVFSIMREFARPLVDPLMLSGSS